MAKDRIGRGARILLQRRERDRESVEDSEQFYTGEQIYQKELILRKQDYDRLHLQKGLLLSAEPMEKAKPYRGEHETQMLVVVTVARMVEG